MKLLIGFGFLLVLGAVLAAWGAWTELTGRGGKRNGAHVLWWRWHRGGAMDGKDRTNSTWREPADKVIHPKGRAHRWHWVRGWRRSAIRCGAELGLLLTAVGMWKARVLTMVLLVVAAAPLVAWGLLVMLNRARNWQHYRHYVKPLRRSVTSSSGALPTKVEVKREDDVIKGVVIEWAPEAEITAEDKHCVVAAVTTRLGIEAPQAAWKLAGRARSVSFTQSDPPPGKCEWDAIAASVAKAGANELVFGLGKRDVTVDASLSKDSPHIAISGGSGGGKSNLAAVLVLQELIRGAIVINLDPKWISHLWLQNLPNVINCHDIPQLHTGLTWLGRELLRRTRAAYYSANGTGRVLADVGPRLLVLCEELNYAMDPLKDYWREIREKEDPKRSPALKSLAALACAGRASDMHLLLMAQMLTAAATGVNDSSVRGNAGIKAMARYDQNNWNMVVGRHIAMPPQPTTPGRIQLVTARGVQETQVPYLHLDEDGSAGEEAVKWAREYAVSGKVALLPTGPEGIPPELVPACVSQSSARFAITAGQGPDSYGTGPLVPGLPPHPVSLREACEGPQPILRIRVGAARKAAQRPGFPEPIGQDGLAFLYDPSDLAEWQAGKVKVFR